MATAKKGPGTPGRSSGASETAGRSMVDPEVLERIVKIVGEAGFTFLDWRHGDQRLVLRRGPEVVAQAAPTMNLAHAPAPAPVAAAGQTLPAAPVAEAPRPVATGTVVTSPFVGTFYRASSPETQPFVEAGQVVRKGQVLCIIEAMKLMNEIEAEVAGKVTEVIGQNGQTVEFGQALFRIEPS